MQNRGVSGPAVNTDYSGQNFRRAHEQRDFQLYAAAMDKGLLAKAAVIFPHLIVPEGGFVLDLGSGTGALAEYAARYFSHARVIAQDNSHELNDIADSERALIELLQANGLEEVLPPNSLDAAYSCSVFHEIGTFGGPGSMQKVLEIVHRELKPGGMFVIRDFVRPSDEPVYMEILDGYGREEANDLYERATVRELFDLFVIEFASKFPYQAHMIDGKELIELPLWAAYEFIMREPYRRNWRNEILETYGHWTFSGAVQALERAGFSDVRAIPEHNDFILSQRIRGRFALFMKSPDGSLEQVEFPATHMSVVGTKAIGDGDGIANPPTGALDYGALLESIRYDQVNHVVRIGDREFPVADTPPIIGTKRIVYLLKDGKHVIKIPRGDTNNTHNVFKSMMQAVERQEILRQYGVRYLPITEIDPSGPPYRYFLQESLPEGSESMADVIRRGDLKEEEVRTLAEWVSALEKDRKYQLDTNPYNWFRVPQEDGSTALTYADGKVYRFDEHWRFSRVGLLQWTLPELIPGDEKAWCALIPTTKYAENFSAWWHPGENSVQEWFERYLAPGIGVEVGI